MDRVSLEGDAVIEDGLGPDDELVGNVSPKSEKCAQAEGRDGGGGGGLTPLSRTKSLGYVGGYGRIVYITLYGPEPGRIGIPIHRS
jgi:hypothetical protein